MYGTFGTHKHRKHTPHTSQDFKPGIICERQLTEQEESLVFEASEEDDDHNDASYQVSRSHAHYEEDDGSNVVVEYTASLLLKLESVHNVSIRRIDELLDDLHFIASSASITAIRDIVVSHFKKKNCSIADTDTFVTSLVDELCK